MTFSNYVERMTEIFGAILNMFKVIMNGLLSNYLFLTVFFIFAFISLLILFISVLNIVKNTGSIFMNNSTEGNDSKKGKEIT